MLSLGPLTNVAQALRDDPGLASRLDAVVISGGAMHVEKAPAPNAPAEWNLFIDSHAADLIFRPGAALCGGRESQLVTRLMMGSLLTDPGAKGRSDGRCRRADRVC